LTKAKKCISFVRCFFKDKRNESGSFRYSPYAVHS
jgi:hypothetical protein